MAYYPYELFENYAISVKNPNGDPTNPKADVKGFRIIEHLSENTHEVIDNNTDGGSIIFGDTPGYNFTHSTPDLTGDAYTYLGSNQRDVNNNVGIMIYDRQYGSTNKRSTKDIFHGGVGDDELYGRTNSDILYGEADNDYLNGGSHNDELYGGAGNDILDGGSGADIIDGGEGIDTVSYLSSKGAVTVNLATMKGSGGDAEGDTFTSIENAQGAMGGSTLFGNDNDNVLSGANFATEDSVIQTFRPEYNERLYKNYTVEEFGKLPDNFKMIEHNRAVNEVITDCIGSNTFADEMHGGKGNDTLNGYLGNDQLYGDEGNDELYGGKGTDSLFGGTGSDILSGDEGNDTLSGGEGIDKLFGGEGTDTLDGGTEQNELYGGKGDDLYFVRKGYQYDFITELAGEGNDTVAFSQLTTNDLSLIAKYNGDDLVLGFGSGEEQQFAHFIDWYASDGSYTVENFYFSSSQNPDEYVSVNAATIAAAATELNSPA